LIRDLPDLKETQKRPNKPKRDLHMHRCEMLTEQVRRKLMHTHPDALTPGNPSRRYRVQ